VLSDKVPYYILDLLQITPTVHVEGLGRFEAIFHPAMVDLPQNKVKPPYIEPGFTDQEDAAAKYNLGEYIAYATGIDLPTAKDAIRVFARNVQERTANGEMWSIEKFGTFSRSALDNIRFTPDWDAFNLAFNGLETLDIKKEVDTRSQPVYIPPVFEAPVTTPSITPNEPEVNVYSPELLETKLPDTTIDQPVSPIVATDHNDQIDQTTTRLWWSILLSAIVLIAILCAYLAWDILSNRQKLDELKQIYPDTIVTLPPDLETVPSDSTPIAVTPAEVEEPTPIEEVQTPATPATEESCYVIVGAFSESANATRMMERLSSMGYTGEEIKSGALTKVAIVTTCDPSTLQKTLNDARASINPEAWIY
jgi:hypothetical protein